MAVKITVGYTDAMHNKIDKKFNVKNTYPCVFKGKDGMDSHTPTVLLSGVDIENFRGCNYAKVATDTGMFGYYYITDISAPRDDLAEITLDIDVLKTYRNQIYNSAVMVDRSDAAYNMYLPDTYIDTLAYIAIDAKTPEATSLSDTATNIAIVLGE